MKNYDRTMIDFNWIEDNRETLLSVSNILSLFMNEHVKKLLIVLDGQKLTRSEIAEKIQLSSVTVLRLLNKLEKVGFVSCQEHIIAKNRLLPGKGKKMTISRPAKNGEMLYYLNYKHIENILSVINTCKIYKSSNDPSERLYLKQSNSLSEHCMIDYSILKQLQVAIKSLCNYMNLELLKKIIIKPSSDKVLIIDCIDVFNTSTRKSEKLDQQLSKQPTVNRHLRELEQVGLIKRESDQNYIINKIRRENISLIIKVLQDLIRMKLEHPIQSGRPLRLKLPTDSTVKHTILIKKAFRS